MRFLLAFAIIAVVAYAFQHFYGSFVYAHQADELKLAAEHAIASWKECQHHYTVELNYSEIQTKMKCQEFDNVAATAMKALQDHRSTK